MLSPILKTVSAVGVVALTMSTPVGADITPTSQKS